MKNILCLFLLLVLVGCSAPFPKSGIEDSLNKKCQMLVNDEIAGDDYYKLIDVESFWSNELETCIMTEVDVLTFDYGIKDIKGNFMKGNYKWLFGCDKNGITNILTNKVVEYDGYIDSVDFDLYVDDMNGGSARKRGNNQKMTRDQCQKAFNLKLEELKN